MLELGVYAVEGHRRVGRRVTDVASILIAVGDLAKLIAEEALDYGMPPQQVVQLPDNEAAIACLLQVLQQGDVVLVKGSRGIAMEQIVEALARPPNDGAQNGQGEG
jgi:UDP-N-acetylmuramoyl-tripeptide--D-alanyl-D-alanine ligase